MSNYKISYSLKKNVFSYDRSNSVNKNKKLRLQTDYADHDYSSGNLKHYLKKPSQTPKNTNLKRKDSSHIQISKNVGNFAGNGGIGMGVHSTKYDSNKNKDLKALFSKPNGMVY